MVYQAANCQVDRVYLQRMPTITSPRVACLGHFLSQGNSSIFRDIVDAIMIGSDSKQWRNQRFEPGGANLDNGGPLATVWVCNN